MRIRRARELVSPEVTANYPRIAPELPDAFATELLFGKIPKGAACLLIMVCFVGDFAAAAQALSLIRGCGKFIVDEIMEMPYVEAQRCLNTKPPCGSRHYWKTQTLVAMEENVVATLGDLLDRGRSPMSKVVIEHLRGEISRIDPDSTPIDFRHAPYNAMLVSEWHDEAQDEANRAWAVEAAQTLAPFSAGGAYTNYMANDSTEADVRAAFGDRKYARLQTIKKQYDPENFFNRNQNVTPA